MLRLRELSDRMLENYVARYEEGGVQPRPCLRFVDAEGRACIVGALAGAASVEEFAESDACRSFLEGALVEISRMFEERRITAADVYAECLLELTRREADARGRPVEVPGPGAGAETRTAAAETVTA